MDLLRRLSGLGEGLEVANHSFCSDTYTYAPGCTNTYARTITALGQALQLKFEDRMVKCKQK